MKAYKEAGFTIVELLIVIVVIAILAAISLVAYTGIQQRATTAALSSAVNQWEKSLLTQALQGGYINNMTGVCLGNASDYPARDGFTAGACAMQHGGAVISYDESSYVNWPTGTRPQGGTPATTIQVDGVETRVRGVYAYGASQDGIYIAWAPQIAGECSSGQSAVSGVTPGALTGGVCAKYISLR